MLCFESIAGTRLRCADASHCFEAIAIGADDAGSRLGFWVWDIGGGLGLPRAGSEPADEFSGSADFGKLFVLLHASETGDIAQYRDRGDTGGVAPADGMDGGSRTDQRGRLGPFRHSFFLATAALPGDRLDVSG